MKKILSYLLLCSTIIISAQNSYKIHYLKSSNGKPIASQDEIFLFSNNKETWLTSSSILTQKASFPYEQTVIYPYSNSYLQFTQISSEKCISTLDSLSLKKQQFEITPEFKTILGYKCQKAKTVINSNNIDLWFTNELNIKGAPTLLGQNLGLVLEMIRNGNFVITATSIEKVKQFPKELKKPQSKPLDFLTYKDLVWQSRFTSLKVFENETIRFSDEAKSNDSILRFANGTLILKKVKFPEIKKGSSVFVELKEQSNGDAYDRTGSVFLIPESKKISFMDALNKGIKTLPAYENGNSKSYFGVIKTPEFEPLLEIMRFFTPFGIKQYNHIEIKDKKWQDLVSYRQDISELSNMLNLKDYWVGTFIGNYDKGGHKISLNITIHNEETNLQRPELILPLFNTTNVMEMAGQDYGTMFNVEKGLEISFTLDKDITNAQLRYITTGHGGWENGDEFIPKKNTIYLDGKIIHTFIPWRQDCGSYRLFNPASGNFPNGLSSSDYSRSNWCPGTVTNPNFIDLGNLKTGKHTIQIQIPQGKPEGTSFSSWNVSGVLLGN